MTAFDHSVVSPAAFERRYQDHPDPWNYQSSPYERGKYGITLDSLGRERYASAFEPACSIGELTAMLAPRCDRLSASDVSETAVASARRRCAGFANVTIERGDLKDLLTRTDLEDTFDLVVFSEVGYYFDVRTLALLANALGSCLRVGGEFVAVHWRGHSADHVLHGDEVHQTLAAHLRLLHQKSEQHPGFRLDTWVKA